MKFNDWRAGCGRCGWLSDVYGQQSPARDARQDHAADSAECDLGDVVLGHADLVAERVEDLADRPGDGESRDRAGGVRPVPPHVDQTPE